MKPTRLDLIHFYYVEEMPVKKIAQEIGVSSETIRNRRATFDLPNRDREWTDEDSVAAQAAILRCCSGASLVGDMRTLASELLHRTSVVKQNIEASWMERFSPHIDMRAPITVQPVEWPKLPIMKIHPDAITPFRGSEQSAGLDLCAVEECDIVAGSHKIVKIGISGSIPTGWVGLICPRSGIAAKHGITIMNAPGVMDSDYRGEWAVILYNTGSVHDSYKVEVGDRVGQIVIVPCLFVNPMIVDSLEETERSDKGFGSTGR